jgi:hypothetical protein
MFSGADAELPLQRLINIANGDGGHGAPFSLPAL